MFPVCRSRIRSSMRTDRSVDNSRSGTRTRSYISRQGRHRSIRHSARRIAVPRDSLRRATRRRRRDRLDQETSATTTTMASRRPSWATYKTECVKIDARSGPPMRSCSTRSPGCSGSMTNRLHSSIEYLTPIEQESEYYREIKSRHQPALGELAVTAHGAIHCRGFPGSRGVGRIEIGAVDLPHGLGVEDGPIRDQNRLLAPPSDTRFGRAPGPFPAQTINLGYRQMRGATEKPRFTGAFSL